MIEWEIGNKCIVLFFFSGEEKGEEEEGKQGGRVKEANKTRKI